jgi:pimeloyl-ACP methyl ester carboxylesterase
MAALVVERWPEVVARRDVVFLDQRGSAGSSALQCDTRIADDPASAFPHVFDPAAVRACRQRVGDEVDLSAFTTEAAVADLDDLRQALGYERVVLWGGSYGTRLALTYMQRYPKRVAFAVLDGVAPPGISISTRYATTLQSAIARAIEDCESRADCAIPQRPLARDLDAMVARLRESPAQTTVVDAHGRSFPVTLSLGAAAYSIRGILYGPRGYLELPAVLRAASRGNFQSLAQRYWERATRLRDLSRGLHLSVMCLEDVPPAGQTEADRATDGTLLGRYLLDEYRRACEAWGTAPTGRVPSPLDTPLPIPALLLSGRFDPSTPPDYADQAARFLPRSRHDVTNAGHGVSFGCGRATVSRALSAGSFDGVPVACR